MRIDFKKADFSKMNAFLEGQTRFSALHNIKKDDELVEEMLTQTVDDMEERAKSYTELTNK
jgi:pyruvate-ferredoxin/flavodoxin oxidoreductase